MQLSKLAAIDLIIPKSAPITMGVWEKAAKYEYHKVTVQVLLYSFLYVL